MPIQFYISDEDFVVIVINGYCVMIESSLTNGIYHCSIAVEGYLVRGCNPKCVDSSSLL